MARNEGGKSFIISRTEEKEESERKKGCSQDISTIGRIDVIIFLALQIKSNCQSMAIRRLLFVQPTTHGWIPAKANQGDHQEGVNLWNHHTFHVFPSLSSSPLECGTNSLTTLLIIQQVWAPIRSSSNPAQAQANGGPLVFLTNGCWMLQILSGWTMAGITATLSQEGQDWILFTRTQCRGRGLGVVFYYRAYHPWGELSAWPNGKSYPSTPQYAMLRINRELVRGQEIPSVRIPCDYWTKVNVKSKRFMMLFRISLANISRFERCCSIAHMTTCQGLPALALESALLKGLNGRTDTSNQIVITWWKVKLQFP